MTEKTARTVRQLFALALDGAAAGGEIATSGQKIVELLRKEGATVDDLAKLFPPKVERKPDLPKYSGCMSMTMPFGKNKGHTIGYLVQEHPDYLEWVLENCERLRPSLRDAIEEALDYSY